MGAARVATLAQSSASRCLLNVPCAMYRARRVFDFAPAPSDDDALLPTPDSYVDSNVDFVAVVLRACRTPGSVRTSRIGGPDQHSVKIFLLVPPAGGSGRSRCDLRLVAMEMWCTEEEATSLTTATTTTTASLQLMGASARASTVMRLLLKPMSGPVVVQDVSYGRFDPRLQLHIVHWDRDSSRVLAGQRVLASLHRQDDGRGGGGGGVGGGGGGGSVVGPNEYLRSELQRVQGWLASPQRLAQVRAWACVGLRALASTCMHVCLVSAVVCGVNVTVLGSRPYEQRWA
jgi:hypothetical protein